MKIFAATNISKTVQNFTTENFIKNSKTVLENLKLKKFALKNKYNNNKYFVMESLWNSWWTIFVVK